MLMFMSLSGRWTVGAAAAAVERAPSISAIIPRAILDTGFMVDPQSRRRDQTGATVAVR